MIKLMMKNYNMILIEKLHKISALSSGKIDKYEYLTVEEILRSNKKGLIKDIINFKQYVFLLMKLEIILLMCI